VLRNQYGKQVLQNTCSFEIEAHWLDTSGGWNSWSIEVGKAYIGGMPAVRVYACIKNHLLNKNTMMCNA